MYDVVDILTLLPICSCHYSNDHLFITENGNDAGTVHILRDYKAALNDLERLDDYWMCIFLDGFDPLYQGTTATHFALPLYAFRGSDTSENFVQVSIPWMIDRPFKNVAEPLCVHLSPCRDQ